MSQKETDMLAELLALVHRGRRTARVRNDLDGACPICDHPFGLSRHACLGTGTGIGQMFLVSR